MPKFRVYGVFTGSRYLGEFEAETAEAAEQLAAESGENHVCLCHQCSSEIELDDVSATTFVVEAE